MQIHKTLNDNGGMEKDWPGLGQVVGKLKIVDQDAIEKFLDERYMHFSAGQSTDAFICMTCGAKWHDGDHCDHPFGGKDEEGNPVYYLCGNMSGRELSIVNDPANDTSFVLGMQFQDSANSALSITINDSLDTQSSITVISEKEMDLNDLAQLEVSALAGYLMEDEARLNAFADAIMGDTQYEVGWLIRVHDSLHSTFDYMLKYEGDGARGTIPTGVYRLHGVLHDTADKKKFRDSFINGLLDEYGPDGSESEKYMYKQDSLTADTIKTLISEAVTGELKTALDQFKLEKVNDIKGEAKEEVVEKVEVQVVLDKNAPLLEDTIDWDILDLALDSLVGDAKLSVEQREALPGDSFCGPNRSFPVSDEAYVTAARELISRAKLSEDQKKAVLASVDSRAKSLGPDSKDAELTELTADYANALARIEELTAKVANVTNKIANSLNRSDEISDLKLDDLVVWLDNLELGVKELKPVTELKPIESPTASVQDAHSKVKEVKRDKLKKFEELVIDTYSRKLENDGKEVADRYLREQLRYLPADFKIENYIVNKE
jgi:hypothetical protein